MKTETTILLEPELLKELNRLVAADGHSSLSEFIESLPRDFLVKPKPPPYDLNELDLINRNAERLYQRSVSIMEQLPAGNEDVDRLRIQSLGHLAVVFRQQGRYAE